MNRNAPLFSIFLALLLATLACGLPLDMPTPAPTALPPEPTFLQPTGAPTPPPVTVTEITGPQGPLNFTAAAVKTSYASGGQQGCDVPTTATLVVNADGTAQLKVTAPSIIDHINCVTSSDETWYIDGTADSASQTVSFAACNFGGFTARGEMSYANQRLSGQVSCFYKDGTQAIMIMI